MTSGGDGGNTIASWSKWKRDEHYKNIGLKNKGKTGHLWNDEQKKKISESVLKHLETLSESEKKRRFDMSKRGLAEYYKSERGKEHALSTSKRMIGENNPQYGLKGELSPNWQRPQSEYCKKRSSETHKGKFVSKDTKRKQQETREQHVKLIKIVNTKTDEYFETKNLLKFCDEHNLSYNIMNGKMKGANTRTLTEWKFLEV
jgi:hypothetical protein